MSSTVLGMGASSRRARGQAGLPGWQLGDIPRSHGDMGDIPSAVQALCMEREELTLGPAGAEHAGCAGRVWGGWAGAQEWGEFFCLLFGLGGCLGRVFF